MAAKASKLGADFGGELAAHGGAEGVVDAHAELVGREFAFGIHQRGYRRGRQHGWAFDDHQMQADAQFISQRVRPLHGIRRGGGAYHQAGAGEDAVCAKLFLLASLMRGERPKSSATVISERMKMKAGWGDAAPPRPPGIHCNEAFAKASLQWMPGGLGGMASSPPALLA